MLSPKSAYTLRTTHGLQTSGAPLDQARGVLLAVHGRGASAHSILGLAEAIAPQGLALVAPQAPHGTWYPQSFVAPLDQNEPYLSRSLAQVAAILQALNDEGVHDERIALMGFSQGACLAVETVLRRPRTYAALLGFSGGYIGPMIGERTEAARLDGMQAFLGCSDIDPHIPHARVRATTELLRSMGASVVERIYPNFGHAVNEDEIAHARSLLAAMPK